LSKKEIEVAFKKNKTSPRVPIHKMDMVYKNVTKSLIAEVDKKKEKESIWGNTKIMLPILNTKKRDKTLHCSENLTLDNIKVQKRVEKRLQNSDAI
jgi:hypothetical protein